MSLNQVTLIGNLGKDPVRHVFPDGAVISQFSVATSEKWNDRNGQRQERTEWHNIVVFGKMAEACQKYLAKGRQVCVTGSIRTRTWDDQDGIKRYRVEIRARNVQFLGSVTNGNGNGNGNSHTSIPAQEEVPALPEAEIPQDEDLPF
jgi:single-strand DNA-binding protein